jgi:hypothetical protein
LFRYNNRENTGIFGTAIGGCWCQERSDLLILILAVVLLEAWALGQIPTYVQLAKFLDAISPAVTAIATAVIALFTATIWVINRSQLAHGRRVDRAYVNGGWGRYIDGKLYANINNDGKTPATVHHMVLAILPLAGLPSTPPALPRTFVNYNLEPYKRDFFSDHVFVEWDGLHEPERVLYARFWYTDVFEKEHESGFLLHIRPGVPAVAWQPGRRDGAPACMHDCSRWESLSANACRPFLPPRASARTSPAISVKPSASSSSR